MKLVTAIIKAHRVESVTDALKGIGVNGMTVSEVRGLLAVARGDIAKASKLFELATTLYGDAENMSDRARCTRLGSMRVTGPGRQ